jgi:hypothetical protein
MIRHWTDCQQEASGRVWKLQLGNIAPLMLLCQWDALVESMFVKEIRCCRPQALFQSVNIVPVSEHCSSRQRLYRSLFRVIAAVVLCMILVSSCQQNGYHGSEWLDPRESVSLSANIVPVII